jgi:hypothetical protein
VPRGHSADSKLELIVRWHPYVLEGEGAENEDNCWQMDQRTADRRMDLGGTAQPAEGNAAGNNRLLLPLPAEIEWVPAHCLPPLGQSLRHRLRPTSQRAHAYWESYPHSN